MEFPALKEAEAKLSAKQKALAVVFEEAGAEMDFDKVKSLDGDTTAKVAAVRAMRDELNDLGKKVAEFRDLAGIAETVMRNETDDRKERGAAGGEKAEKTAGDLFVKSRARTFKGEMSTLDIEVKTLMERSAGWAPESTRSGRLVDYATRPIQVTDLIPTDPVSEAAFKYMEETTFTAGAVETAEGGTYGEAAFALTERSVTIEKIGVWIPVTDEQIADETFVRAYLDRRLPFAIRQRLDGQILTGDGSTPNILGINNKSSIQTQAKGSDNVPDAIYKAMTKVKVTGRAFPSAVVMHPNDWQAIRLLQTSDGNYIWGPPSMAVPAAIWGLPVVETDAQTENTAVVGDFANYSLLLMRSGMDVKVTDSHSDYFIKGKQAIRADIRCATAWLRAAAFATVTGI